MHVDGCGGVWASGKLFSHLDYRARLFHDFRSQVVSLRFVRRKE